jgi:hypothetical protein
MRGGWALAAVAVCGLWAQPGFAQTRENRLLVIEPLPEGVAERIAGQTADLAWTIDHAAVDASGVQAATRLAAEHHARALLWVVQDGGGFTLRLFDARKRRVLERRFDHDARGGMMARSAALESLALALRSSLRALEAEEDVGQAVSEDAALGGSGTPDTRSGGGEMPGAGNARGNGTDATRNPRAQNTQPGREKQQESARAQTESSANEEEEEEEEAEGPPVPPMRAGALALVLAGGWSGALDGQSPLQHGPWARVGVAFARVELAAQGDLGLGTDVRYPEATLHVGRSVALASAAYDVLQGARARVALGLEAGVASFARETTAVGAGLTETHATSLQSLALGCELRAGVQLIASHALALDLELDAGLLALPAAPVLRYPGANGSVDHALWVLQPALQLGPRLRIAL